MPRTVRTALWAGLSCAALMAAPAPASAQDGYLFKPPAVTLSLRAGSSIPDASDAIHNFLTRELTLDRKDFIGFALGGDLAVRLNDRADLVLGVAHARTSADSEFRNWVGEDDLPILQTTSLSRTPLTVSMRFFPLQRGRSVGEHAWVPAGAAPYFGVGGGMVWYTLEQEGEFLDVATEEIFPDHFYSSDIGPLGQVFGGLEWWPATRLGLTLEARYSWGAAALSEDFDFDRIDLRGAQLMAGISTRF
jgi:hypothetical protein